MANEKKMEAAQVDGRLGYVDTSGLVFASPMSPKKDKAWRAALRKNGYELPGDAEEKVEASS